MTVKQITVEEFQEHCVEELKQVTEGVLSLQLTVHGKVVAVVDPANITDAGGSGAGVVGAASDFDPVGPANAPGGTSTLGDWMGAGKGLMSEADIRSFDEPTFSPEDWEDHPANRDAE